MVCLYDGLSRHQVRGVSKDLMLKHGDSRIDWLIFFGSVATIILLCIPLALNPDSGKQFLENAFDYLTENFGFLYVLAAIVVFGFLFLF